MTPPTASTAGETARDARASFFRQSGWLMIANVAGGALMWLVHFLNKFIPEGAYGSFGTFLAVVMLLPTIPLQMILAQQTARAIADGRERELSGLIRMVWIGTFGLWLLASVIVLALQKSILDRWHMTDPLGLWVTLPIVLFSLWLPMFWGILQGQQNFLWFGWSMLSNGITRLAVAAFAVLVLHAAAAGMMAGVLCGLAVAVGIAAWHSRSLWMTSPQPFDWRGVLQQLVPIGLAFLGFQVLFTADTLLVKSYFSEKDVDFYVSAGTLSRALMWLVLPLAAVMFPRLVQSGGKSEKTNLMGMAMAVTAVLAVTGAVGLSVLGPWVVRIAFQAKYVEVAAAVLPWYAGAMVPLALANVLMNQLFARPASKWGPALCIVVVAAAYLFALTRFHDSFVTVLKTMGLANLVLLAVCAWFTWGAKAKRATAIGETG